MIFPFAILLSLSRISFPRESTAFHSARLLGQFIFSLLFFFLHPPPPTSWRCHTLYVCLFSFSLLLSLFSLHSTIQSACTFPFSRSSFLPFSFFPCLVLSYRDSPLGVPDAFWTWRSIGLGFCICGLVCCQMKYTFFQSLCYLPLTCLA